MLLLLSIMATYVMWDGYSPKAPHNITAGVQWLGIFTTATLTLVSYMIRKGWMEQDTKPNRTLHQRHKTQPYHQPTTTNATNP